MLIGVWGDFSGQTSHDVFRILPFPKMWSVTSDDGLSTGFKHSLFTFQTVDFAVWTSHATSTRFASLACVLEGLGIPPFGSPRGDRNWRIKGVDKK